MTGILVATHGGLAEGLLNAVELVAGKQEKIKTIGLYHGDGIDEFAQKVKNAYEELEEGDGVLTFVDLLGGSPSNAVMNLMREKPGLLAIAGVNMPMLVQAVLMREMCQVEELCDACSQAGSDGMILIHEKFKEMAANISDESEDDF